MIRTALIRTGVIRLAVIYLAVIAGTILTAVGCQREPQDVSSHPGELRIAVASNFEHAMSDLVAEFQTTSGVDVTVIPGSTGKLHAQITNGAPFDLFFAADIERPQRLEADGAAVEGSRFTYARGRLALWTTDSTLVVEGGEALRDGGIRFVAIANRYLAPYGRAAAETIEALGLTDTIEGRLVRGENVNQAYTFVETGNAELGFVAYSQLIRPDAKTIGAWWLVPDTLYAPIEQQAILVRDSETGRAFLSFVHSDAGKTIIRRHGYETD